MNPSIWTKDPWEERIFEFDTANSLASGDSLASVSSIAVLLDNVEQTAMISGSSIISGNKVYQKIIGGVTDTIYIVRVRIITTNGEKVEDTIIMTVKDS